MKTLNWGRYTDTQYHKDPINRHLLNRAFYSRSDGAFCINRVNITRGFTVASLPTGDDTRDFRWTKGELRADGYVYGAPRPDGAYDYELTYYPAEDVLRVVEKLDLE